MTDPIRVLHFADTHIGMETYGRTDPDTGLSTRVVDFLRRMDDMVAYAREGDVDLVIFAGDAFKTRSPNPTYQREFAWRVRDLAELAPTVLLVGNHDLPPTVLKASSIEIYDTLAVHNVWVASDYETRLVETKRGPVIIGTAPYPIRSRVMQHINTGGMTIAQTDAKLQEVLSRILDDLAAEADEKAVNGDTPRLLTGHFTVSGALFGSERSVMLGRDVAVLPSSVADPRWDYVALGHIHKHQNLTQGKTGVPPVVYSGSLERIDFGEEGDPKGYCWVELARGDTTWHFEQVPARPFVTLRADCRQSQNPTERVLHEIGKHDLEGAVVRLILQMTPQTESRFTEAVIRDALRRKGIFSLASIRKDIDQPARAQLGASPEGLTHEELLERYLISKEVPPDRRNELMDAARVIMDEV